MILQARRGAPSAPYSIMAMDKRVRKLRLALGVPSTFTLDACRHGGMTELARISHRSGCIGPGNLR
jgi:hypothetical protein